MGNDRQVYVVTGALGSIGRAIAHGLAAQGVQLVLLVRDAARGEALIAELRARTPAVLAEAIPCDLASLASVRAAAAAVLARHTVLHGLVNSAAVFSGSRKTTADGHELLFGVNHLAHFLLTNLLEQPLRAGHGRVVVMTMPAKASFRWDDLMLERRYSGMTALTQSKAANLLFTRELAARWRGAVSVHAIDPGIVKTTLISEAPFPIKVLFSLLGTSPETGADTPLWAATSPELDGQSGAFYKKRKPARFPKGTDDADTQRRLWTESERLVGLA